MLLNLNNISIKSKNLIIGNIDKQNLFKLKLLITYDIININNIILLKRKKGEIKPELYHYIKSELNDYISDKIKYKNILECQTNINIQKATILYIILEKYQNNILLDDINLNKYIEIYRRINDDCRQILSLRTYNSNKSYIPLYLIEKYKNNNCYRYDSDPDFNSDSDFDSASSPSAARRAWLRAALACSVGASLGGWSSAANANALTVGKPAPPLDTR